MNYKRVAEADGKEVDWKDIVKGYEYEKGKFVVLKEEDFKRVDLEAAAQRSTSWISSNSGKSIRVISRSPITLNRKKAAIRPTLSFGRRCPKPKRWGSRRSSYARGSILPR